MPLITVLGLYAGILIGSSVMTEIIFSGPVWAASSWGPCSAAITFHHSVMTVYATVVILINLLTDLSYGLIDPRIRYE